MGLRKQLDDLRKRRSLIRYSREFGESEMEVIKDGIDKGLDVSIYAKHDYNWRQMQEIRKGLEKGLDVSVYAKPEFDDWQMREIRRGLEQGVDVSIYAKPEFDHDQMMMIREGLEQGLDVSIYAKPEFDWEQMGAIEGGLEDGVDVSVYADPDYCYYRMDYIRYGLKKGLDTSIYDKPEFSFSQMDEIIEGLENGVDVSIYAKPEFDHDQMHEIRNGLERGIDVSIYAKPEFDYRRMKEIRAACNCLNPRSYGFEWRTDELLKENLNDDFYKEHKYQIAGNIDEEKFFGKETGYDRVITTSTMKRQHMSIFDTDILIAIKGGIITEEKLRDEYECEIGGPNDGELYREEALFMVSKETFVPSFVLFNNKFFDTEGIEIQDSNIKDEYLNMAFKKKGDISSIQITNPFVYEYSAPDRVYINDDKKNENYVHLLDDPDNAEELEEDDGFEL